MEFARTIVPAANARMSTVPNNQERWLEMGRTTRSRPPHLVGLIRPVGVRHSADAEDERSEGEVPEV